MEHNFTIVQLEAATIMYCTRCGLSYQLVVYRTSGNAEWKPLEVKSGYQSIEVQPCHDDKKKKAS